MFSLVKSQTFFPLWMEETHEAIKDLNLFEISLPGTHDSISYDLSTRISDGGIDDYPFLADVLNKLSDIVSLEWLVTQSQTQSLTITEQLNSGIRFIDFRIMYTSDDWYCLHMLQSKKKAIVYLQEIRDWLIIHPSEIVVIWLSKHGSECATGEQQFPGVEKKVKRIFWKSIENMFISYLNTSNIRSTISDFLRNNHRVIFLVSDYEEFTDNGTLAYDACEIINNDLDISDVVNINISHDIERFKTFQYNRSKFHLLSMASSSPKASYESAAKIHYIPGGTKYIHSCAAVYGHANLTQWCPETLLDFAQLNNYYHQYTLSVAFQNNYTFPNAFYIDAIDHNGLIRIGNKALGYGATNCHIFKWTSCSKSMCDKGWIKNGDIDHFDCYASNGNKSNLCIIPWQTHKKCCRNTNNMRNNLGFGMISRIISYNVMRGCLEGCEVLKDKINRMIDSYPVVMWNDELLGRREQV